MKQSIYLYAIISLIISCFQEGILEESLVPKTNLSSENSSSQSISNSTIFYHPNLVFEDYSNGQRVSGYIDIPETNRSINAET